MGQIKKDKPMSNVKELKLRNSNSTKRRWAVIAPYYVNMDLTHAEAVAEAEDLRRRNQPGVSIVTNHAARQLIQGEASSFQKKAA